MTASSAAGLGHRLGHDPSLAGLVRRWSDSRPDAPALTCDGTTRSWRELVERCSRLAQGLRSAGVEPGDRVAFLGQNTPEYFELLFGGSMAGAVTTAVNWRLAPREIAHVLAHSGATLLVVEADLADTVAGLGDRLPALRSVVTVGEHYETWLAGHPPVDPRVPVTADATALLMYTSGTTGRPKGVMFSNQAFAANLDMAGLTRVTAESRALVAMPLFHSAGTSFGVMALGSGAHTVVAREAKASVLLDLLERWRVTTTMLVPTVLQAMVETPDVAERDLAALDTIVYAASPISPDLLSRCLDTFSARLLQNYGLTETQCATVLVHEDHVDSARPELLESAGRPLPTSTVRVTDPAGAPCAEGVVGEIRVRARTAMQGYWNDPVQTAEVLDPEGFVRTGDAGYLRDGYLYLCDRIKDMIVSGAENVYPIEVENVLADHPGVHDVAVIGVPSDRWGETVLAIVVRAADRPELDADALIAFARERLAAYKCPTRVEFAPELPRNPSGKVLKRVLREPFWEGRLRRIG
ncbi:long-chain-fatty-acid--CoA ligase [Pseudonocardia pini]|uniref:long-chain-fatty-acid--CoA ligase n=1 Tax=Pseudonocardia pini TaxID=2758030 RepID=UPI0015F06388|nr:long-chain-fatty-acid--CoA ligase [Pseudonocardia pini]